MIPTLRLKGTVTKVFSEKTGYLVDENHTQYFFHFRYTIPHPNWIPQVGQRVEFTPLPKAKDKPNPVAAYIVAL